LKNTSWSLLSVNNDFCRQDSDRNPKTLNNEDLFTYKKEHNETNDLEKKNSLANKCPKNIVLKNSQREILS